MSLTESASTEVALRSILTEHFEIAENPHVAICKMWLLLNADPAIDDRPPDAECALARFVN